MDPEDYEDFFQCEVEPCDFCDNMDCECDDTTGDW